MLSFAHRIILQIPFSFLHIECFHFLHLRCLTMFSFFLTSVSLFSLSSLGTWKKWELYMYMRTRDGLLGHSCESPKPGVNRDDTCLISACPEMWTSRSAVQTKSCTGWSTAYIHCVSLSLPNQGWRGSINSFILCGGVTMWTRYL